MKLFRRLLQLFRPYWSWMAFGILMSFITLLANVTLMAVSGWFIAAMALAGLAGVSMNYFTPAAIIRAMAITRTVGRYVERLVTHEATFRLLSVLRVWFFQHLEPLAPARLQMMRAGDLLSRIRADIDTLEHFYLRFMVPVAVAILALPTIGIAFGYFSPLLALVVVLLLLAAGLALPLVLWRLGRTASARQVETASNLRARFVETKQGLAELTVYGALGEVESQIDQLDRELIEDQRRLRALDGVSQGAIILAGSLAAFAALIIATPLVRSGALAPANLVMLSLFALAAFEAVTALPAAVQSLPMVTAAARRLFEIVDAEPLVSDPENPLPAPKCGDVVFKGVSFAYREEGAPVLQEINLHLSSGMKIAVIGATGSGKSSLINLLLRFYEPQQGKILIDGEPTGAYRMEDIRRLFAVVPQRIHLFNTTIRANLLLAREGSDDAALLEVCRLVGLDEFIEAQPKGLDTFVGEAGLKLSGGQIRRLGIARALLKDAPVLVLDEPGEGLDAALEWQILENIRQGYTDRSLLLITHSLRGLEWMDEILVLEGGRVIERGRHDELWNNQGAYRDLHNVLGEFSFIR